MRGGAESMIARARAVQPHWAARGASERCAVIGRLRRTIALECEPIAESIARETAKPLLDALSGDVMVTLEMMRYYEMHAAGILRPRKLAKPSFFFRGARFESHLDPHGVALVIAPSNYPFQLSMVPAITALAAGNAVVLKCSERTPQTAALIASLCARAGLPQDVIQVVHGGAAEAAALMDARPDIILFTGSSRHGRMVAEQAARHLVPAILELGGKDAALVFADCHLERAIEGITYGAFSNAGQVCVGVKRVYVEASIYEAFLAQLRRRIATLRVSADADADLCPISGQSQTDLRTQIEDALARGATLEVAREGSGTLGSEPVLLTGVPSDARILTEECSGPVLCVAPFDGEEEALRLANGSDFALSASVWTRDAARGRRVANQISAGSCAVNDVIRVIANPHAAFGGNRLSGYGRYHGAEGLRAFCRSRTVLTAKDHRTREIHWFPFKSSTARQLAKLLRFRHGTSGMIHRISRWILPVVACAVLPLALSANPTPKASFPVRVPLSREVHRRPACPVSGLPSGVLDKAGKAMTNESLSTPSKARKVESQVHPAHRYTASAYKERSQGSTLDRGLQRPPREKPGSRPGPWNFDDSRSQLGTRARGTGITVVSRL